MVYFMKTILVTGATCELGKEICRQLIEKSCRLILTSRSNERLQSLQNDLEKIGGNISIAPSDFTDIKTFDQILEKVSFVANGGLDGLVLIPPQPEATTEIFPEESEWENLFRKSFIGPSIFLRKLMPHLLKKNSSIVFISGVSSKQPFSNYTTSNTIRTAWLGFSKTIADNFGPKGVRFNTLSLGGIKTEKFLKKLEEEAANTNVPLSTVLEGRVGNIPLRRYAEIPEIAEMVSFLLLSLASRHMTGQNIVFDGGFTRAY